MRFLGLDPGLRHTGWGVITFAAGRLSYVAHGVIKPPTDAPLSTRLSILYQELEDVITRHSPEEAAVEETFVNQNAASALKLGMARGVVLLAPASRGLRVGEYSANRVKKAMVGAGHASKEQMMAMVARLLPTAPPMTADAADALAVAICHAQWRQTEALWEKAS